MRFRWLMAIAILGTSALAAEAQAAMPRPVPVTAAVVAPVVRTTAHPERYDLGRALARMLVLRNAPIDPDAREFVLERASAVGSIVFPGWIERAVGGENALVEGVRFVRRPILLSGQTFAINDPRERDKLLFGIAFLGARALAQHRVELRFRIPIR